MYKVAIQGTKGSFHQEAAEKFFKDNEISYLECMNFPDVVKSVRGSDADFGVIAIENALIGTILTNYKLIESHQLNVIGELYLPIHLNLMALPGDTKQDLKEVWSHPLAILQSENYLDQHQWEVVKKEDTATCAKKIYRNQLRGVGVLASDYAAQYYNLTVLDKDVQNENDTYTRFFVISSDENFVQNADKTSLAFSLSHQTGTLWHLLQRISDLGINLSKIMSVPLTYDQEHYRFYVDAEFQSPELYNQLMNELNSDASDIKIFGKYKK